MSLETQRLLLVPVSLQHTTELHTHFTTQIGTYMFPAPATTLAAMEQVVQGFVEGREKGTDAVYAITKKDDGEFLGIAALHHLDSEIPELGIWTKLAAHGNHYGREAIGGLIDHARVLCIKKLCYPVDRRNISSVKIPLFYGGIRVLHWKKVLTPDGRTLEEECYEIEIL